MKKKNLILVVVVLFLFSLFAFKDVKASSNDNVNDIFNNYVEYYQNSDELYDMSDRQNITKTNYKIQDYNDSLYANNIEINYSPNKSIILGDDPVINIVPKECFYNVITEIYYGEEYVIFVDTNEIIQDNKIKAYKTHIAIIDINNNIDEQNDLGYYELSLNILFEYDYVTLIKNNDYVLPYWEQGLSSLYLMEVSSNIDLEYIVVPVLKESNNTLVANPNSLIELSNIEMECLFLNSNDFNTNDQQYNVYLDDGYYITATTVDYHATSYSEGDFHSSIVKDGFIMAIDSVSFANQVVGTMNSVYAVFKDTRDLIKDIFGIKCIYEEYESYYSYTTGTNYLYASKNDQINNYGGLIKSYKTKYFGPSLSVPGDHVISKYQYSNSIKTTPTKIYEVLYCNFKYKNNDYDLVNASSVDLYKKETSVNIDTVLYDEYNVFGGKTTYNYNPSFSQELEIMCGNNDVRIYENDTLISTSKTYNFIKGHDYKIEVINNKSDLSNEIYNFYFKGKNINDSTSLNSGDSVLYTYIPSSSFVKYFESNVNIDRLDLIYFEKNKIYQFILTNNNSNAINSYLSIKDIPNIRLDNEGHILNSEKYVLFNQNGCYKVEFRVNNGYYFEYRNDKIYEGYNNCFIAGNCADIYFVSGFVDKIIAYNFDIEIYYTDNYYKDIQIYDYGCVETYYSNSEISYSYLMEEDFDIVFDNASTVSKDNEWVSALNGTKFSAKNGYGIYMLALAFSAYDKTNGNSGLFMFRYKINYLSPTFTVEYESNGNDGSYSTTWFKMGIIGDNPTFNKVVYNNAKGDIFNDSNGIFHLSISKANSDLKYIDEVIKVELSLKIINYDKILRPVLIGENSEFGKVSDKCFSVRLSKLKLEEIDGESFHIISKYSELKEVLCYSENGYIAYDDGLNYDVERYGNVNIYNFKLISSINCNGDIITVNKSIFFGGIFDGKDNTISNLKLVINKYDSESKYRGIFAENYGTIKNIKFDNVEFDIRKIGDVNEFLVGFISPLNRGKIVGIDFNDCKINYQKKKKNKLRDYSKEFATAVQIDF